MTKNICLNIMMWNDVRANATPKIHTTHFDKKMMGYAPWISTNKKRGVNPKIFVIKKAKI